MDYYCCQLCLPSSDIQWLDPLTGNCEVLAHGWGEQEQEGIGFHICLTYVYIYIHNMSDMSTSCSYSRFLTKRKALQSLSWTTKKFSSLGLCQSSVMEISIDCQQNTVPQKTFKQKIRRPQQSAGGARPRKSFSRILGAFQELF